MIEVCCGSYEDGMNAFLGGAKRIELNSALYLGGLTPSCASLKLLKQDTTLKIICMVRARGAGFCFSENEYRQMYQEAKDLLEAGADGLAFGFLNDNQTINIQKTQCFVELCQQYHKEAVFHRAFDITPNLEESLQILISLHVNRVLTSGGEATAIKGQDNIKYLQAHYGDQIEILAGSGINKDNAKDFKAYTQVKQIHSSCKTYHHDPTTFNAKVSYAYHDDMYEVVDQRHVQAIVAIDQQI